tara:strand:+ start:14281 stop:15108 length:828 start_codon:yes stop_codon:yes gene_type:complete
MRKLNDIKDYIITAIILIFAVALMVNRHDGSLQNIRKISVTALSFLEQPLSNFRVYRQAVSTNTYLHRQNILLQDELSRLRSVEQQNRVLRSLLNIREQSDLPLIPVKIVAKNLVSVNSFITIDAGLNNEIEPGMPVINSDGLIGMTILTDNNYTQVLPYNNSVFRVSAIVEGTRAYGIVSWPGPASRELIMEFVPETIDVIPGQYVLTSGFTNQFPAGIPIGEVTRVEPNEGVDTQTIYLNAFTDLSTASEAFVVVFRPDTTINNLINDQIELF